jgi:hypothetical protein
MANRFLQSLLGEEDFEQAQGQARNNALLMAGLQGLLASGPSPTPVGFGQVLGQAGMAGVGAYDESMQQFGQQGLQSMELDRFRQEQADLERQREADEAFGLAAQEIMAGGRVDYNKLQQLATAFPERAAPLINALQAARPPEAPQVNLQFDARTGTIFNPRDGTVRMAEGFAPQMEEQGQMVPGSAISPDFPDGTFFWAEPGKAPKRIDVGTLTSADQMTKAAPILSQYVSTADPFVKTITASDEAIQALESADDFAVQKAILKWAQALNAPLRTTSTGELVTESGLYAELVRVANQVSRSEALRPEQRAALRNQIQQSRTSSVTELNRTQDQYKPLFEGLDMPEETINKLLAIGVRDEALPVQTQPPVVTSDAQYNALPSGAEYVDAEGNLRRKR